MKKPSVSEIMAQYSDKYIYIWTSNQNKFYAMEKVRRIGVPRELKDSRKEIDTFRMFHEIGHMETYGPKQTKAQREYNATQWAIDEFNRRGLRLKEEYWELWQNYIYSFTKAKDKSRFDLDWGVMDMPF